jgi:HAD superfamily hydrolase (TIGR01549 family)
MEDLFKAIIFDWDGTLADTREVIVESFRKAVGQAGLSVSREFVERRIGIGAEETFKEILKASNLEVTDSLVKHLIEAKNNAEINLGDKVVLFDGAVDLLKSLNGHVKLALASMNSREVIDHLIRLKGVASFFEVVMTADEVQHSKPHPEIFLKAASKLDMIPEECVVVEDSIFGVQAAKVGKMGCIAVLTGVYTRSELEKAKPDIIVHSLKEKSEILSFVLG